MIPLPFEFNKRGFTYRAIDRAGDVAVYAQSDPETKQVYGYEVFIVQKQEAGEMFGKAVEAKELAPGSEQWGSEAYTVRSKEEIPRFMYILQKRIEQREYNRFKRGMVSPNFDDLPVGDTNGHGEVA